MSHEAHYAFPPASAFKLNRCLYSIKSDPDFCERFLADPPRAMAEVELPPEDREALWPIDRDRLVARGAHPYLVFMADLRLRIAREPGSVEYF